MTAAWGDCKGLSSLCTSISALWFLPGRLVELSTEATLMSPGGFPFPFLHRRGNGILNAWWGLEKTFGQKERKAVTQLRSQVKLSPDWTVAVNAWGLIGVVYSRSLICLSVCLARLKVSFWILPLEREDWRWRRRLINAVYFLVLPTCVNFLLAISILLVIAVDKFRHVDISP